jgi:hypothetical protein
MALGPVNNLPALVANWDSFVVASSSGTISGINILSGQTLTEHAILELKNIVNEKDTRVTAVRDGIAKFQVTKKFFAIPRIAKNCIQKLFFWYTCKWFEIWIRHVLFLMQNCPFSGTHASSRCSSSSSSRATIYSTTHGHYGFAGYTFLRKVVLFLVCMQFAKL